MKTFSIAHLLIAVGILTSTLLAVDGKHGVIRGSSKQSTPLVRYSNAKRQLLHLKSSKKSLKSRKKSFKSTKKSVKSLKTSVKSPKKSVKSLKSKSLKSKKSKKSLKSKKSKKSLKSKKSKKSLKSKKSKSLKSVSKSTRKSEAADKFDITPTSSTDSRDGSMEEEKPSHNSTSEDRSEASEGIPGFANSDEETFDFTLVLRPEFVGDMVESNENTVVLLEPEAEDVTDGPIVEDKFEGVGTMTRFAEVVKELGV